MSMGAESPRRIIKIAPRKYVPRQNQLSHWYSPASKPANAGGATAALLACSAFTSTRHPRKYRISAIRHPRSTVGGIGHPFASTQMLIEVPPHTGSLPWERGEAPLPGSKGSPLTFLFFPKAC